MYWDFLRAPGANTKSRKEELKGLDLGGGGAPLVSSSAKTKLNGQTRSSCPCRELWQ